MKKNSEKDELNKITDEELRDSNLEEWAERLIARYPNEKDLYDNLSQEEATDISPYTEGYKLMMIEMKKEYDLEKQEQNEHIPYEEMSDDELKLENMDEYHERIRDNWGKAKIFYNEKK